MDAKATAKSKRAHSLHHKPKKPHPTPSPSSSSSSSSAAAAAAGGKHNPPLTRSRRHPPHLPTNWDRYVEEEEEEEEGGVDVGGDGDFVKPKSKGADFGYLLSEAENQLRSRPAGGGEDGFSSFDGAALDFDQGLGTIFSSYAKSLVSWTSEDNFVVDDHSSSSYEASFLSIDLDALADHLAKLDPSERLFIEADRLPEELQKVHLDGSHGRDVKEDTLADPEVGVSDMVELNANAEVTSSGTLVDTILLEGTSQLGISDQVPIIEDTVLTDEREMRNVKNHPKKTVGFEATAAEAELDMLLDSIGETQTLDSFGALGKPSYSSQDRGFFSKNAAASSIDTSVDDLLSEASHLPKQKPASFSQQESRGYLNSSSTVSKTLDDFDSWLDSI